MPRYHEKQLLYTRSNERITSTEPHPTVHTKYSNRAVLQHTSNGGAHTCEPEQPVQVIYPLLPLYAIAMYAAKDAYCSYRENAWTTEASISP